MLQTVKKKFAKLSNYPRFRILLIVVGVVIVFIIAMNLLSPAPVKPTPPPSQVQAVTANSGNNADSKAAPANQVTQYQQLSSTNAASTEQNAIHSGDSVFENAVTPADNSADTSATGNSAQQPLNQNANPPSGTTAGNNTAAATSGQNQQLNGQIAELQKQLTAEQQQQQNQLAQQNQQQQQNMNAEIQNIQSSMRTGLDNITNSWQLPTLATVQGQAPQASTSTVTATTAPVAIQAGTILFGVIDTALDSDQPGTPVLATVVTGPYKGAKLLGGFTAENDALVVQFNLMTMPQLQSSIPISAYAIDENTANNAIASNVDNHYLLRYGMLFASAFLQGFGNAYQNTYYCPPGTINCTMYSGGSNAPPSTSATTQTAAYQGLGQIGTNLSQVAANVFNNTPPTITVNQGTAIGVLFNSDVRIPLN